MRLWQLAIGLAVMGVLAANAQAQLRSLDKFKRDRDVRPASYGYGVATVAHGGCADGCGLWPDSYCPGGAPCGSACGGACGSSCGYCAGAGCGYCDYGGCGCCGTIIGELVCGLKSHLDRKLHCLFGCLFSCGGCDACGDCGCDGGCGGGYYEEAGCDAHAVAVPAHSVPYEEEVDPFQDEPTPVPPTASGNQTKSLLRSSPPPAALRRPPARRAVRRTSYQPLSKRLNIPFLRSISDPGTPVDLKRPATAPARPATVNRTPVRRPVAQPVPRPVRKVTPIQFLDDQRPPARTSSRPAVQPRPRPSQSPQDARTDSMRYWGMTR